MSRDDPPPITCVPFPTIILDKILAHINGDSDSGATAMLQRNPWRLEDVQQAKSAQQQVFILKFSMEASKTTTGVEEEASKGALNDDSSTNTTTTSTPPAKEWTTALEKGGNRLVLRLWKGGSQWWNLHQNGTPLEVAHNEVMGYQVARQALSDGDVLRIPQVLLFEKEGTAAATAAAADVNIPPWAVLEYVGPDSLRLPSERADQSYRNGMVKIRKEFGCDEPHPRWGRVPEHQALEYARLVLAQVVIPLHRATRHLQQRLLTTTGNTVVVHTYQHMVEKYRKAGDDMNDFLKSAKMQDNAPIMDALEKVRVAVEALEQYCSTGDVHDISPVLVHMDLQPQNLIFVKANGDGQTQHRPVVHSVLDWEEAAWADPRFDILMLCRKVCANREQGEAIWSEYECAMSMDSHYREDSENNNSRLGSILPWLQLETVHSITTLLLQSMDLLNGGRNPWETKQEVCDKLLREFSRWEGYNIK